MHQFFSASRICINSIASSCIIFASIFNLLSLRLYFSCFSNVKCNSFLSFAICCVPQYALTSSRYCSLPPLLAFKYSVLPLYKKHVYAPIKLYFVNILAALTAFCQRSYIASASSLQIDGSKIVSSLSCLRISSIVQ